MIYPLPSFLCFSTTLHLHSGHSKTGLKAGPASNEKAKISVAKIEQNVI